MRRTWTRFPSRGATARVAARVSLAALLSISLSVGFATASMARPSRRDLQVAKNRVDELNRRLSLLVEQYDQTSIKLQAAEQQHRE